MRGKKGDAHIDPADPPRRRGNAKPGHGTFANDRPPVFQIISRQTGEVRVIACDTANRATCQGLLGQLLPLGSTLYSDELSGYVGWPAHFTVCHSQKEYARDADGDGVREVHCNTCEGAHTALRNFLRRFQGVHKAYLACYLAVYEAVRNAKRITPEIIRRFCFGKRLHAN